MLFTKIKGIAIGLFLVGSAVTGAMVLAQVPKGADDRFATTTTEAAGKSAPQSYSGQSADAVLTKQAAGPYVRPPSDSDRLHAVEQKLDRILEALGSTGSSGSSFHSVRADPRVAADTFAITTATPSADVAPAATRDNSITATRKVASRAEARFAVTTDRLTAVERRMADLEQRLADLERRLNQQRPLQGVLDEPAARSRVEPSIDALPKM
jgi:hypothetical protein